ncbi:hypothetical protein A6M21_15240 [Desulfotomaculum copahuensis]|uniref:Uncharacterized protein n=1 Tax=Desulfotomaculum copahuensis TaxID=1838280 RepID=A0A1B7LBC0_9FIRM|nr:hypothetical protein A6M21_15240 [Desulfotomaculum copahuensis]
MPDQAGFRLDMQNVLPVGGLANRLIGWFDSLHSAAVNAVRTQQQRQEQAKGGRRGTVRGAGPERYPALKSRCRKAEKT